MNNVHFVRVHAGLVTEKGWTDPDAFAVMQVQSAEYVEVTKAQFEAQALGQPLSEE